MKRYLLFLLTALLLGACTEPITLKTDDSDPVIVIYGLLTDENKPHSVRITRSSPYFDPVPNPAVSDAVVTISYDDQVISLFEDPEDWGTYYSATSWQALPDTEYRLNVDVDFDGDGILDNYQASTTFRDKVYLDSIRTVPINIMGLAHHALNVYGQDSPEEDYYIFNVWVNDSLVTEKISKSVLADDQLFNGQYIAGLTVVYFEDISLWEDDDEDARKRSIYVSEGDRIRVGISTVPKGYFDFLDQCMSEMNGENPMFGGPASNITTNISNGGVGYFSGYCTTYTRTVISSFQKKE